MFVQDNVKKESKFLDKYGMEYDTRYVSSIVGDVGMKVCKSRLYQDKARLFWQPRDIVVRA